MFRPYDQPSSSAPFVPSETPLQRLLAMALPMPAAPPDLPSDWEELELDQRVRAIGEW